MKHNLRRLASPRLTVALLLVLAAAAALGTLIPQGLPQTQYEDRYPSTWRLLMGLGLDRYYGGIAFRSLLVALAANLFACASGRAAEGWKSFRGRGNSVMALPIGDRAAWKCRLREAGFRIHSADPLVARRQPWAFLGFPLVHLAPFAILAGGLWGSTAGFVGTRSVYVGQSTAAFDNWSARREDRLPFQVSVEDFRLVHYPIALKIGVSQPDGSERVLVARVGTTAFLPDSPYAVHVQSFDIGSQDMVYYLEERGGDGSKRYGPYSKHREEGAPLRVRPAEYKDPEVRRAEAMVVLRGEKGEELRRGVMTVNDPITHGGIRLYLTAWGQDAYQNPYVGLQFVRDPGQPLLWSGAVLLSLGLFLLLFGDGAWVREERGRLTLKGSRGRKSFPFLTPLERLH